MTQSAQDAALASLDERGRGASPARGHRRRAARSSSRRSAQGSRCASVRARWRTSSTWTPGGRSAPLFDALLREGVIVRPLAPFGAPEAIRVTVGTADENALFGAGARPHASLSCPDREGAGLRLLRARAPGFRARLLRSARVRCSGRGSRSSRSSSTCTERTDDARWVSPRSSSPSSSRVVVVGLLAGPLVDRLPRRAILICVGPRARRSSSSSSRSRRAPLAIVLLALAAGIATSLFRPALYAGLPNLVSDEDLPQANGAPPDGREPHLGDRRARRAARSSPWPARTLAYVVNAVSFVVSAVLLLRIRESLEEVRAREPTATSASSPTASASSSRSRPLLTVLIAWSIVMLSNAAVNVAEVFLATDVFDAGEIGFGILVAAGAVGLVLGSFSAGGADRPARRRAGRTGSRSPSWAPGSSPRPPRRRSGSPLPFVVLSGIGNGAAVVCNVVLVQRGAPDALRGRAFSVLMGIGYGVLGLGMIGRRAVHERLRRAHGLGRRVRPLRRRRARRLRPPRAGRAARRGARLMAAWTREALVEGVRAGDRRALARAISPRRGRRRRSRRSSSASSIRRRAARTSSG